MKPPLHNLLTVKLPGLFLLLMAPLLSQPQVRSLLPRGAQRGTEVLLAIRGNRLDAPEGLVLYRPGITVLAVTPKDARAAQIRVRIAEDCPLGEHTLHVRTARGLSALHTFVVGALPEIQEKEPNGDASAAQAVALGTTVNGTLQSEDVDVFALDLPAGPVSLEVEGLRLGEVDCDPLLTLESEDGSFQKVSEDTALGRMDPWLVTDIPKAGRYFVRLRETAFGGSSRHHYRLHVGSFPRPAGALPAGGVPGEEIRVKYLGRGGGFEEVLKLPADAADPFPWFPSNERGVAPTPILLDLSPFANVVEPEHADHGPVPFAAPAALNGVISKPGERDVWTFEAKRRTRLNIEVRARTLRSPLDAVIAIRDAKGAFVSANDDSGGPDSKIRFTAPADGTYSLIIRDHLRMGGASWFYRIIVGNEPAAMATVISTPRRDTPTTLSVPRGGRMGIVLAVSGINRMDEIVLGTEHLPAGVTAAPAPVHGGSSLVPLVLTAAPDAPLGASLVDLAASAGKGPKVRDPGFRQVVPLVRVENNRIYWTAQVDRIPVAVCEALPFRLQVDPLEVPLVRGSAIALPVKIHRDAGFTAPIRVSLLHNPPGIRSGAITIPGNQPEGRLAINHSASVPPKPWKIAVLAEASVGGRRLRTCSDLLDLQVVSPYYIVKVGKARATRGDAAELPLELKMREAFTGKVKLEIPNLPRGVTATIPELDQDSRSVKIGLAIDGKAPAGRFRNLVLRFHVPLEKGVALQQVRGGELRIDTPLPPRPRSATSPAAPKKPKGRKRAWGTVSKPKT